MGFTTAVLALVLNASPDFQCTVAEEVYPDAMFPEVKLETSLGEIVIELDRRRAPVTANNFLRYLKAGAYDNTVFHRVVAGFVVQGGGYEPGFRPVDVFEPIINESGNGLANDARTVAMARHEDPHSATSQFYFNLADNEQLNPNRRNWGYTVFGRVTRGWEVVEAIGEVVTGYNDTIQSTDVPVETILLHKASLVQ